MTADRQTMLLHAVPLLILAVLYGLLSILIGVSLLRERRASVLGLGIWLLFTVVAVLSALIAGLALADRDVLADEPSWLIILRPSRWPCRVCSFSSAGTTAACS